MKFYYLGNIYVRAILYLLLITVLYGYISSQKVIRLPRFSLSAAPADFGLKYESIEFLSSDGLKLRGWFIPALQARGTIILCHGYGTNRSDLLGFVPFLHKAGYNTFLFDFRAHGESEGKYISLGYHEKKDLIGAIDYLKGRNDIDSKKIGIIGFSMGGAVAILVAAESEDVRAVVADGSFTSFGETVAHHLKLLYKAPRIPFALITIWFCERRLGFNPSQAAPVESIARISPRPVFIISGDQDVRIPVAEAKALFASAKEPKELWLVQGAGHMEAHSLYPEEYEKRILSFFNRMGD